MAEYASLQDLIKKKYYNEIWSAVADYVSSHSNRLGCRSYIVQNPDDAELEEFTVKFVDAIDQPGRKLSLNIIVEAEIILRQTKSHHDVEEDSSSQWFDIKASCDIEDGINNFMARTVTTYGGRNTRIQGRLSDTLVPVISASQLDGIAEEFLRDYYPEALTKPIPLNVNEVARRMGLIVQELPITQYESVFGEIVFADTENKYYDPEDNSYKSVVLKRGTIVVDPKVYFLRSFGSVNNTVIHECVHWYKHRKFYELAKLFDNDKKYIRCKVNQDEPSNGKRSPYEWMEWQANALAPRILMPAGPTKQKSEELISKYKTEFGADDVVRIMEATIGELAEFFAVSKLAAKIRMIDLGYDEASGVMSYVDDHYVPGHHFKRGSLKSKQTFTVSMTDAAIQYVVNPKFRKLIETGAFVYVDSLFCLNSAKYITLGLSGNAELTPYAINHLEECCLKFNEERVTNSKFGTKYYKESVLFKSAISKTTTSTVLPDDASNDEIVAESKNLIKDATKFSRMLSEAPSTFSGTLKYYMKKRKLTDATLAERALLSERTIQRLVKPGNHPTNMRSVIAVCLALHLHPILSEDLLKKAGLGFQTDSLEHAAWHLLLESYYDQSVYVSNEMLQTLGFKVFGKEE